MVHVNLRVKLGLTIALIILLVAGVMVYFFVQQQKAHWLEREKESNHLMTSFVVHHIEDSLADGELDEEERGRLLEYIEAMGEKIVHFRVVDENARILVSLDAQGVGEADEDKCVSKALRERKTIEHIWAFHRGKGEEGEIVETFGFWDRRTRALEIVVPYFSGGRLAGAVHIYTSLVELTAIIDRVYLQTTLLATATYVLCFLFLWIGLSRFVYRPIDILKSAADQVARGDFTKRARIVSRDEFGDLFVTFNRMTETLSSLIAQVEAAHRQTKSSVASVGRALGSTLDRSELLRTILNAAIGVSGAQTGSVMLLDEKSGNLVIEAAHGLDEKVVRTTSQKLGQGIAGWVAKEGEPLLLIDGVKDQRFEPIKAREEIKDAICVPLRVKDKIIGVLNVNNKVGKETFDHDDLEFLAALANEAAVALENAELYQDIRRNFFSTIRALAEAVDAKDPYTRGHSERVTQYALAIAQKLGLFKSEVEAV
ncbi:MAG: GAF domain-containing protein [Actinomycetota bacterium]|nr:GAF domain-containing protein [Actinomycetota bacterium]